ncbi:SDR family NAD(P)-dependent oxidoreductase [Nocardia harenae]|uniref:SDR family NAD(P)-dependent oxidoreductase n=1 Tax=Nocardia harenae TaxID=358707 RepID=UPI00082BF496|nr:SDR family NAD(P)-dependent oxidoreductase [Nocardia harenae]
MPKWTTTDIPDQTGRTAIVTGANSGLGFETAKALAAKGARVVLAVRDLDEGGAARDRIIAVAPGARIELQRLDLAELAQVREAARELAADYPHVDLLVNNAGVMFPPKQSTRDGFELQLGTNYLGHFALTGLLLEHLLPVRGSRVVTISSLAHQIRAKIHFDDLNLDRNYSRVAGYGQSKLANLIFAYELQRRLAASGEQTASLAAHPGNTTTDLGRYMPSVLRTPAMHLVAQPVDMGVLPILRAATDPTALGGQYYGPDGIGGIRGYPIPCSSSKRSHDTETARRLWEVSEELTGVTFSLDSVRR